MRRASILSFVVMMVIVLSGVPAFAGPVGDLNSAFHTELNQLKDPAFDAFDRPEGHISPFGNDLVPVCSDLVVGTWFSLSNESKSEVEGFIASVDITFILDGQTLDATTTPIRQVKASGTANWGTTIGVPVIGLLDEGTHTLTYTFDVNGDGVIDETIGELASTELDVSAAHC